MTDKSAHASADICFQKNNDGSWNITKNRYDYQGPQNNLSETQKKKIIQEACKSARKHFGTSRAAIPCAELLDVYEDTSAFA